MQYVFIVKPTGERITSYIVGVHGSTVDELKAKAATEYPEATTYQGGDDMQNEFTSGKWYTGDHFFIPDESRNKSDEIAAIKAEYEPRFQRLKDAILQRALIGAAYTDIQAQYKKLTAEMATAIKGVK